MKQVAFSAILVLFLSVAAQADVGPPVKVVIPPDKLQPAISGQEYLGTIEIKVGANGDLADFQLSGQGWRVTLLGPKGPVDVQAGTSHFVEFRGTPIDAEQPLMFTATFSGRNIHERINLGQKFFEVAGKPGKVASLDASGRIKPFRASDLQTSSANTAGQSLHFFGRIVYQRPTSVSNPTLITVGADYMWFEINDDDSPDPFDDHIYRGYTDINGYFDVNVTWDDCDVSGCDDPDIYIRWETDNYIVAVQSSDVLEEDYSWSTEDDSWDDFDGHEIDFGTLMSSDPSLHPAVHIHNSIVRAWRYMHDNAATDVDRVEVQWPEDASGAFYESYWEEIHIGPDRQWKEDTHTHEYGHHFLEIFSVNPEPDYCNQICDPDPGDDDCGHCVWCPETDHDAWNEGWPNWLADVVTRSYPLAYTFVASGTPSLDGSPYQPLYTRSQETITPVCDNGMPNDPLTTEGYAGALVGDIEDGAQDDHNSGTFNCNSPAMLDCTRDALALGVDEIFMVVRYDQPSTPLEFLQAFRNRYPQYDQDLWSTATNVAGAYSFVPPTPEIVTQSPECKMNIAGQPLSLVAQGNGSVLRYQWERFNVDVNNDAQTAGAQCSTLTFNPLTPAHAGIYRAEVSTCDQSSSTMSDPIRVTVFPARGAGTRGASFGRNDLGQLGNGLTSSNPPPLTATPIDGLAGIVQVSGGGFFASALLSDGTVWGWGYCRYGECGRPSVDHSGTPAQVAGISDVISISSNGEHTLALKADGSVWGWGRNNVGQLGFPLYEGGFGSTPIPKQVPQLDCVTSVAAGNYFSIASRSDGTVWTWGSNSDGERGNGTIGGWGHTLTRVSGITDAVAVSAGGYHALVVHGNGTVSAWGRNTEGQLGDGTFVTRGYPGLVSGLTNVRFATAGVFHSLTILNDGSVRVWGENNGGQLGTGDFVRAALPIQPIGITNALDIAGGYSHTIILKPDRTVWGCGVSYAGQLGTPAPSLHVLTAVQIPGLVNVENVDAGDDQTFILSPGVGPAIFTQPVSKTVLAGQPAQFSVTAIGAQPFTYQWSRAGNALLNGSGLSGANTATISIDPALGTVAGSYTVRIENLFGFAISVPVTLTVNCPDGDGNCDGIIDPVDAADLAKCLNGPGGPRPAACAVAAFGNFDANNDNDVDLRDAAVLQRCFAGDDFIDPACGQ
jgi:alpha-tubulin suppressor-like RCC1 family protein